MAVSIYSALVNLEPGWSVELYIIDGGIAPGSKRRIENVVSSSQVDVKLHWYQPAEESLASLPLSNPWLSAGTYLRFWIPEFLPSFRERAIYLDSDLLVEASLSDLWTQPFNAAIALAVQDFWIPYVSCERGVKHYDALGLDPTAPYFNGGVLVLNVTRWRKEGVTEKAIHYLKEYGEEVNHEDQESLNVVLSRRWNELDLTWNVPHYVDSDSWSKRLKNIPNSPFKERVTSRITDLRRNPRIRHFVTSAKPWKSDSHYPAQHRWYHYLWESGWLSERQRLESQMRFYSKYYSSALQKGLRDKTRSTRHRLARHLPAFISSKLLKRDNAL
jgi:lipopolysaccharide biosynthesis glycosyltransferase